MIERGLTGWDGGRLRAFRLAKGLTRPELARAVGVTKATIYFWESEHHHRSPSPANLRQIAAVLGVDTTALAPLPDPPTLTAYREHAGLRQIDIADALGYKNRNVVSDIEQGGDWWPPKAERWAELIGITIEQFSAAWEAARRPPAR
jgi:transcriptional regulator with XRE-family HTH domain